MCGIIGYTGHRPATPLVLEGLEHLEYRGYDSAGIGYVLNRELKTIKAEGKLSSLKEKIGQVRNNLTVTTAIGHTRWATHGVPEERNAHPHLSNDSRLAIVHNGIIENYLELKEELAQKGYHFVSDTDTEVLVNLISEYTKSEPDLLHAFARALKRADGAYAVCIIDQKDPNTLYAARKQAPLILGKGIGENFIASDIPAFLSYTRDVLFLEDKEILIATSSQYRLLRMEDLTPIERSLQTIHWNMQAAQKGGYRHFMLKEIFEQPKVISDCLTGRIGQQSQILLPELDCVPIPRRLHIIACGTSFHAGLWAKHLFENWAKIPCSVEIASEFRYKQELLLNHEEDAVIVISQSGETADTLAALERAKSLHVPTIGVCNVLGSSIAREAEIVLYTQAGPEISVASTKAMTSQMLMLSTMALYYARRAKRIDEGFALSIVETLRNLPQLLGSQLENMHQKARELSRKYANAKSFFYLGRGHTFPLALEGALKLKELSYIHAEGYASGEMKHGPIALIDPNFPSFVIAPYDATLYPKIKSNIVEIQARQGKVIALTNAETDIACDDRWEIPPLGAPLDAFLILPCLQLFSYEVSDYLGKDVDQPRNLAKSVTVE